MTDVTPSQASCDAVTGIDVAGSHAQPPRAQEIRTVPRRLLVSSTQLDKLEERGYLDPDLHGNRADDLTHSKSSADSLARPG
jgi:hypothetical protein